MEKEFKNKNKMKSKSNHCCWGWLRHFVRLLGGKKKKTKIKFHCFQFHRIKTNRKTFPIDEEKTSTLYNDQFKNMQEKNENKMKKKQNASKKWSDTLKQCKSGDQHRCCEFHNFSNLNNFCPMNRKKMSCATRSKYIFSHIFLQLMQFCAL